MMGRVELVATLFGPIYFGAVGSSFVVVAIWATICAVLWMWRSRKARTTAASQAFDPHIPSWYRAFSTFALFLAIAALFNAVHFAVFFLVRMIA